MMSVYVDDYQGRYHKMVMSHLMADSLDELHKFARRLGLRRTWFQDGSAPHYDVSQSKRSAALRLGAIDLPIIVDNRYNSKWLQVYRRLRDKKIAKAKGGET